MPKISVAPLSAGDMDSVATLQPEGWGTIVPSHLMYLQHDFCLPFKAITEDRIVGLGTTILHADTAWLAHIIVHPDYRRQGIGQLITEKLIDTAFKNGCSTITLVATDLGAPVYEKLGFTTDSEYIFYKDVRPKMEDKASMQDESLTQATALSEDDPLTEGEVTPKDTSSINIRSYDASMKSAILALDRECAGEDREQCLQLYLRASQVYVCDDNVQGFYMPEAGDGLIVANNPEAGLALMQYRLRHAEQAVFPSDNLHAKQFYENLGYQQVRLANRMILGKKREWKARYLYNRIGGNLG